MNTVLTERHKKEIDLIYRILVPEFSNPRDGFKLTYFLRKDRRILINTLHPDNMLEEAFTTTLFGYASEITEESEEEYDNQSEDDYYQPDDPDDID